MEQVEVLISNRTNKNNSTIKTYIDNGIVQTYQVIQNI